MKLARSFFDSASPRALKIVATSRATRFLRMIDEAQALNTQLRSGIEEELGGTARAR